MWAIRAALKHRQRRRMSYSYIRPAHLFEEGVMSKPEASENRDHLERRSDETMLVLVQGIQYDVHNLQKDVEAMRTDLVNHISTEPNDWAKTLSVLMADAFPEGDAEGHRKIHEANIKAAEDKAAFWKMMVDKLKVWGLLGFTFWAAKTLIEAAAVWVQHGAHIK